MALCKLSTNGGSILSVDRSALAADEFVYIGVVNKAVKYPHGDSRIVYIGRTTKGVSRVAKSAADRAGKLLDIHGLTKLDYYVVKVKPIKNMEEIKKLERALLIKFREMKGQVPLGNTAGKKMRWKDEKQFFTDKRLESILDKYSK